MILLTLILVPIFGGLIAYAAGKRNDAFARWIALAALALDAVLLVFIVTAPPPLAPDRAWLAELSLPWIPRLGSSIHLALDGLSLLLIALTLFLGIVSVLCSWTEIRERVGFFHLNLLWTLAGIMGVFLALDLLLFYFFWELMLVPMYFLISIWGHEGRARASLKFLIFTQAGGFLMFLSILALYLIHGRDTGFYTFDLSLLQGAALSPETATVIMLGFLAAFLVKLPVVPLHTWLPDAHTEAPTAGSVILAGLLLKTGAYGILRFALPLFPDAAATLGPTMMLLAVIGIIYGAVLAFGQTDLKRLVAYTSVSHMGFVLLGIFAGNLAALSGAVMQMLAHGLSTGALFLAAGMIQERIHTRELDRMGGFWSRAPRLGALTLVFALASLGLPGTANFVGEFLVLLGAYRVSASAAVFAASGLVLSVVYSLWIIQRVFHGGNGTAALPDIDRRESFMLAVLLAATFWLGLHPRPVFRTAEPALSRIQCCAPHHARPHEGTTGAIEAVQ